MKEYNVILSKVAVREIDNAVNYIANNLQEQGISKKLYNNITKAIKNLKDSPHRHAPIEFNNIHNASQYRKCIVGRYIIFYSIHEEKDSIYVERVIHGTRDWMSML